MAAEVLMHIAGPEPSASPLVTLARHNIQPQTGALLDEARRELVGVIDENESGSWGYFPGRHTGTELEVCQRIGEETSQDLLGGEDQRGPVFGLTFVYAARAGAETAFSNFHVDANVAVGNAPHHAIDPGLKSGSKEVVRKVFNAHSSVPLVAQFVPITRLALADSGIHVPADPSEKFRLPERVPLVEVTVPPRTPSTIHSVEFAATRVPHAYKKPDRGGFFLVGYGALAAAAEDPAIS